MKLYVKIILIFSLALNVGVFAAVLYKTRHFPSPEKSLPPEMERKLDLTEEQKKKIGELKPKVRKSIVEYHSKINQHRKKILELFRVDNPDKNAIMKELDEINGLRSGMSAKVVDNLIETHKIFTPQQREAFLFMVEKAIFPETGMEGFRGKGFGHKEFMERDQRQKFIERRREMMEKNLPPDIGPAPDNDDNPDSPDSNRPPHRFGRDFDNRGPKNDNTEMTPPDKPAEEKTQEDREDLIPKEK